MASSSSISICHLLLGYYPQIGGTEVQARRLACYQRDQGCSVCVVARRNLSDPLERQLLAYETIDGIPVYRVPVWGQGRLAAMSYLLAGLWQLLRLHRHYQVIHAHMISAPAIVGGLAGRLLGKKVVAKVSRGGTGRVRVSDSLSDPDSVADLKVSLSARFRRFWLKTSVDRYLAISRSIANELCQIGLPCNKVISIPNGIDVNKFAPSSEDRMAIQVNLDLPPGLWLTYTGLLRPRKNLGVLIEGLPSLLKSYPSLRLILVGAGVETCAEEEARLRALQYQLGLEDHVFFIKHTNETVKYLQASQLFAIPSFSEGLSNAMLEAMAVGLPVIVTPVSGAEDLIQDGVNGVVLSPSPTPEEVAQAIAPLLQDANRAREMGCRARQTVMEHCSFDVVGEQILALYRTLLEA